jgi:hypothetical protein
VGRWLEARGEGELLDMGSDAALPAGEGIGRGRTVEESGEGVGEGGVKGEREDRVVRVANSGFVRRRRGETNDGAVLLVLCCRDKSPRLTGVPPQLQHRRLFLPLSATVRPHSQLRRPVKNDDDSEQSNGVRFAASTARRGGFGVEGRGEKRFAGRSAVPFGMGVGGVFAREEVSNDGHRRVELVERRTECKDRFDNARRGFEEREEEEGGAGAKGQSGVKRREERVVRNPQRPPPPLPSRSTVNRLAQQVDWHPRRRLTGTTERRVLCSR